MHLETLTPFNFRNLENQGTTFSPGLNFIVGLNGQGKTNIIEAISLLGSGRSFRTASLSELIRLGESSASVFARVATKHGSDELGVILERRQRQFFLNKERLPRLA